MSVWIIGEFGLHSFPGVAHFFLCCSEVNRLYSRLTLKCLSMVIVLLMNGVPQPI